MFGIMSRKKKKKLKLSMMGRKLITVSDTKSIISEQFRTIRANITFSMPDQELKTILVTSSTPGEGKSTNASNLGVVFAQEGKKVLLVDADMRKPTLHYTFNIFNTLGLSTVLTRQHAINNAIQETFVYGLYVIPSGPIPPNPAELLSSKMMEAFMEDAKKNYDIVIFDAPPILSVSDAQILSNKCDGTLLIVNYGVVEKEIVLKAKATLTASQAKILGVVLNNYVMPRNHHYYKYYSSIEE
ncbi:CpsD/CapB family tyrosine-protein kinase [Solibacillus sp. FSL H8-0538]|uniref:CpsD/CapB family tyrosine-protein kinase n=1 Tax=Solibacillus sp. FSL H8-0538 TaxID=2921400 RepID=UPI0030F783A1